jgi:DNA-binding LacI/PurR family transcriptional regulator
MISFAQSFSSIERLPKKMASMKDVARLANVSESTVSRVINRSMTVDGETRGRVEEAVRKLNYKPNLLAKGLRIRSSHLIGLLVPEIVHHTFASFIQYVEESTVSRGYSLIVGNHNNEPELEESFIDNLLRRNVDGIIFSRVSDESRVMRILSQTRVPVVVIDRAAENEELASVVLDNHCAGQLAGEHLASLGHMRFGCISGPLKISLCRERLAGFAEALGRHCASIPQDAVVEGDFKYESGIAGAAEIIKRYPDVTAIWAQNDLMAVGALKYLTSIGRSVPRDISLVGMDDISLARMISPALTTVVQPFEEICERAVALLMQQKNGDGSNRRIVIPPVLVTRESTAKR